MKQFYLIPAFCSLLLVAACGGARYDEEQYMMETPTVDYIEGLDVYSAQHKDSFLNQLAMNYRSYAIYNARQAGYPDIGEIFAQKAVAAFSGETPYPESLDNWQVEDNQLVADLRQGAQQLEDALRYDSASTNPEVAAEAQAKYDCWLSASASGQWGTAEECAKRFDSAMTALYGNINNEAGSADSRIVRTTYQKATVVFEDDKQKMIVKSDTPVRVKKEYYPETANMRAMTATNRSREGVIVVNNVNIPDHLIQPQPIITPQPMVFNQNIIHKGNQDVIQEEPIVQPAPIREPEPCKPEAPEPDCIPQVSDQYVSRQEFINVMMALRSELAAINARLDNMPAGGGDKTILKVQQIPLEPKQHVMEEIFEIRFDFDKAAIKPEYENLIRQLSQTTQANRNVKVTVVGHTDTSGSESYNYALGGRRAEAVRKMLMSYGIPSSQIVAVSSGEKDLKVPTGDGVPNADNRRVRVVKEVHYTEEPQSTETKVIIKEKPQPRKAGPFLMPVAAQAVQCPPKGPEYGYPYGQPVRFANSLEEC